MSNAMMSRRRFFAASAAGVATLSVARIAGAQQAESQVNTGAANAPMESDRYKPVQLAAKGAPLMDQAKRDELEHHLHCQCGCNLDVYTCRTTDFSCEVSPAMHRDVMALVAGGYSAPEFIALLAGIALVLVVLRLLRAPALAPAISPSAADATPTEQARLDALVRSDDR